MLLVLLQQDHAFKNCSLLLMVLSTSHINETCHLQACPNVLSRFTLCSFVLLASVSYCNFRDYETRTVFAVVVLIMDIMTLAK